MTQQQDDPLDRRAQAILEAVRACWRTLSDLDLIEDRGWSRSNGWTICWRSKPCRIFPKRLRAVRIDAPQSPAS